MKKILLPVLLVVFACVFGACSKSARLPQTITVSQESDESSKSVSLVIGDTLVVEMPGNPTTGYTWKLASDKYTVLESAAEPRFTPGGSAAGAPGKFTFVYRTVHIGEETLEFVYHRPFEPNKAPIKTFSVRAKVK